MQPIIISVAPNGARKTKSDHPNLPMTPSELAKEARSCYEAGASLIHLHVRDKDGKHSLDTELYQDAISAIEKELGDRLIIQTTTEAVGVYQPHEQMRMVWEVKPEAASVAIKEIIPEALFEKNAADFLEWAYNEQIFIQYILYSAEELQRFYDYKKRGIIPGDSHSVLFVLGRYSKDLTSTPKDLLPYLQTCSDLGLLDKSQQLSWSVCAFGPQEASCMSTATAFGGNPRIGFENNQHLSDGSLALDNAALIQQYQSSIEHFGRQVADADTARGLLTRTVKQHQSQTNSV